MSGLATAETYLGHTVRALLEIDRELPNEAVPEAAGIPVAEWTHLVYGPKDIRPDGHQRDVQTHAFVHNGRWIARCPFCPSAQIVAETDHRFFCPVCENQAVAGAYITVVWPDAKTAAEIERLLLLRPSRLNQHWKHGESLENLRAENERAGI